MQKQKHRTTIVVKMNKRNEKTQRSVSGAKYNTKKEGTRWKKKAEKMAKQTREEEEDDRENEEKRKEASGNAKEIKREMHTGIPSLLS